MGRKVRIATWAMNNRMLQGKSQEEMVDVVLAKIDSIAGDHPDVICLPEIFLKTGGDKSNASWPEISARMVSLLQQRAKAMGCYIVASVYEQSQAFPDMRYNCGLLIDRQGEIAGKYHKQHTVYEEATDTGVIPGGDCPVFDTDFGRVGILICFDIGWRDTWRKMAEKGANLVFWLSAYDGGNLLNTYAAYNMYYVVSSVRTDHARIVDITGRTIALSSCWNGLAMATIDLETTLFHIDRQFGKIDALRKALGDKVTIQSYSEENVFTIETNDPAWPISRICREFGLMTYADYHAEADVLQKEFRERYRE